MLWVSLQCRTRPDTSQISRYIELIGRAAEKWRQQSSYTVCTNFTYHIKAVPIWRLGEDKCSAINTEDHIQCLIKIISFVSNRKTHLPYIINYDKQFVLSCMIVRISVKHTQMGFIIVSQYSKLALIFIRSRDLKTENTPNKYKFSKTWQVKI